MRQGGWKRRPRKEPEFKKQTKATLAAAATGTKRPSAPPRPTDRGIVGLGLMIFRATLRRFLLLGHEDGAHAASPIS
jgi:hypothetical protein